MKIAVIGSRGLVINDLGKYLPANVTEIVSGGAKGIDTCAKKYALSNGIKLNFYLNTINMGGERRLNATC